MTDRYQRLRDAIAALIAERDALIAERDALREALRLIRDNPGLRQGEMPADVVHELQYAAFYALAQGDSNAPL